MNLRQLLDAIAAGTPVDLTTLDRATLEAINAEATQAWQTGWDPENKRPTAGTNPDLLKAIGSLTRSVRERLTELPAATVDPEEPEAPPAEPEAPVEPEATFDLADVAALFESAPAEPTAVAAGANLNQVPLGSLAPRPAPAAPARPSGLVAAAGPDSYYNPAVEHDMTIERLHEQVLRRGEAILAGATSMGGTLARIASTSLPYTSDLRLSPNNTATQNTRLMDRLDAMPQAKTAAGGFIGPVDFSRDIPWYVKSGRPVKDSLRSRPAQRGRIKLNRALPLYDVVPLAPDTVGPPDGIGQWTKFQDAAADLSNTVTWKVCEEMDDSSYPAEVTIETYALTKCFRHSHMQAMSSPELLEALLTRQRARFDRYAESMILQQWYDTAAGDGTAYTLTPPYGQATDTFAVLAELLMADGWKGRYSLDGARLYVPQGFFRYLVLSEHNQGFGDRSMTQQKIKSIIADLGFGDVVEYIDDRADATAWTYESPVGTALPAQINTSFGLYILFPEDWVALDAGTIDFGIDRDIEARVNKVRMLWETFEGLGNVGNRPTIHVQLDLCAAGNRAALITPFTCPVPASGSGSGS